uniref:F-box domain-containing protein n=1 Tax=Setaria italica TaxID=4555 RepID=K4A149_SETIT
MLPDDAVGEILRRLPPDEPACLVRASLVCKSWRLLISEPDFLLRYHELHPTPLWLGFNCHHDRVLLHTMDPTCLVVWDPITNDKHFLPEVLDYPCNHLIAAVLCAANGCNHSGCHGAPFLVWSTLAWIHLGLISKSRDVIEPGLLIGNTLYFLLEDGRRVLKYDLGGHHLSVMNTLPLSGGCRMGTGMIIELDMMLSMDTGDPSTKLLVVGFSEGVNTIFITANAGIFAVDLKSDQVKKICGSGASDTIIPYASFYTPDFAGGRLQPPVRMQ